MITEGTDCKKVTSFGGFTLRYYLSNREGRRDDLKFAAYNRNNTHWILH